MHLCTCFISEEIVVYFISPKVVSSITLKSFDSSPSSSSMIEQLVLSVYSLEKMNKCM